MDDQKQHVIVYGATGFTGQLVAEEFVRRGLSVLVAGRNTEKLETLAARLRADGGNVKSAAVEHTVKAMTALFTGSKIVFNISGPFNQIGSEVVEASLNAGCHYLDVTGEQDFMMDMKAQFGKTATKKKLAIISSNAFHWAPGGCAADIALETPGVDTIEVIYQVYGFMTLASAKSSFRVAKRDQYENRNGTLSEYKYNKMYRKVAIPGLKKKVPAACLGTAENVWFENDSRLKNMQVLRADPASRVVGKTFLLFQGLQKVISRDKLDMVTDKLTDRFWKDKPREEDGESEFVIVAKGTGPSGSSEVILRGDKPYYMTGVMCGYAAEIILAGKIKSTGFTSPYEAFGARELIEATAPMGITIECTSSAAATESRPRKEAATS